MLTKLFRPRIAETPPPSAQEKQAELPATAFRNLFAQQASSVSVVTFYVEEAGGRHLHGFTATSVTPVSMDPPLALFCIGNQNRSARHLARDSRIGISFLAADQSELSARFAAKSELGGYADVEIFEDKAGVPLLKGAVANVEGAIKDLIPAGDHTIYLCRLGPAVLIPGGRPLLYHARTYHTLGEALRALQPADTTGETD